jgi:HNH endonuclease
MSVPASAIPCDGPLLYSASHFVTPTGDLYVVHPTTGRARQITLTGPSRQYLSWANAQRIVDGDIVPMESIEGFYTRQRGRVLIRALVAYYFVERLQDPTGMRACLIRPDEPISADNLIWRTADEQTATRMENQRAKIETSDAVREIDRKTIDLTKFTLWNGYYVCNDGTKVLSDSSTGVMRDISIRTSTDGYKNIMLHIGGNRQCFRMNRLMATIHHGDLTSDQVVDHIDGDILNNALENLAIVDIQENTRRGKRACRFARVDPITCEILERYRCIEEFCSENDSYDARELSMRLSNGTVYKGFLWVTDDDKDVRYTESVRGGRTFVTLVGIDKSIDILRSRIENHLDTGTLNESMIPIVEGIPIPTTEAMELLADPRGVGNMGEIGYVNRTIIDHLPCCRILSFFGRSDEYQIVLCLVTLVIFKRSRDNLLVEDRKCPMCVYAKVEDTRSPVFAYNDPWASIPIYEYSNARLSKTNADPLRFIVRHATIADALSHGMGVIPDTPAKVSTIMNPLRWSLFACANGYFAKSEIPKRAKFRGINYASFYSPVDGYLDETTPSWILRRRLQSAQMTNMREYLHSSYSTTMGDANEKERAKVAAANAGKTNQLAVIQYDRVKGEVLGRYASPTAAIGCNGNDKPTRDQVSKQCIRFKRSSEAIDLKKLTLKIVFLYEHDNQFL